MRHYNIQGTVEHEVEATGDAMVTWLVEYYATPIVPATHMDPAEGGLELEDWRPVKYSFPGTDGKMVHVDLEHAPLTAKQVWIYYPMTEAEAYDVASDDLEERTEEADHDDW